jgi:hypothetical protein
MVAEGDVSILRAVRKAPRDLRISVLNMEVVGVASIPNVRLLRGVLLASVVRTVGESFVSTGRGARVELAVVLDTAKFTN